LPAELARAVGPRERGDDDVAALDRAYVPAHGRNDADELVPHAYRARDGRPRFVRPEIAATDAGACHGDQRIGRLDDAGVGDRLDADVAGAVHDGGSHALPLRLNSE